MSCIRNCKIGAVTKFGNLTIYGKDALDIHTILLEYPILQQPLLFWDFCKILYKNAKTMLGVKIVWAGENHSPLQ